MTEQRVKFFSLPAISSFDILSYSNFIFKLFFSFFSKKNNFLKKSKNSGRFFILPIFLKHA